MKNYADTAIAATNKNANYALPVSLILPKALTLNYGQSTVIEIKAENFVPGLTIQAYSDFDSIAKVKTATAFDVNGSAQITIEGILPGETNLVVRIPEIGILRIVPLTVATIPNDDITILVSPGDGTEVMKGGSQQFTATSEGLPITVTWTLDGNIKAGTTINAETGLLTVASDETAKALTVTANYEGDVGTATIAIVSSQDYILGDVNNDGEIDGKDVTYLARYLAEWSGYALLEVGAADINRDGDIDGKDVTYLARYLAEWTGYSLY